MITSPRSLLSVGVFGAFGALVALGAVISIGCSDAGSTDLGVSAGALESVTTFGSNPGGLVMYRYVPAGAPKNAPLVVALHGCTQHASDYEKVGWNALADTYKFYVVYAEQTSANNPVQCFDWWGAYNHPENKDNITRGRGESESIAQMVDKMKADYGVDGGRVFVTGVSGGGAMAAVMLAAYPDVFAGGAIFAGVPYDCPSVANADVWSCIKPGKTLAASDWGDRVRKAFPGHSGPLPRVSVWQGTKDSVVDPANEGELVKQWTNVHGLDAAAPSAIDTVDGQTRIRWNAVDGTPAVEEWKIAGMDHGVPVDPAHGCGTAGAYVLDAKICSALHAARFFGIADGTSPPIPPPPPPPPPPPSADAGVDAGGKPVAGSDAGAPLDASPPPPAGALVETFSTPAGPDLVGWSFGKFTLDASDHTGASGSRSIHARLRAALDSKTATASIVVHVGAGARLAYARRIGLSGANIAASARFAVTIADGGATSLVDERVEKLGSYTETPWTPRAGIDLSAWAGRDVTLSFVVSVTDPWSYVSSAEAWIDDIRIE